MKPWFILIPAFLAVVTSCRDQGVNPAAFQSGTIQFVEVEGGCWAIFSDDGQRYRVPLLEKEFQTVGLRVEFSGVPHNRPSIYMWGRGIDLVWIRVIK